MSGDNYSKRGFMRREDADPIKKMYGVIESVRCAEGRLSEIPPEAKNCSDDAQRVRSGRYFLRNINLTGEEVLDFIKKYYNGIKGR